jgi:dihydroxyacid dehydratase/phosphogluconate dehydratase
MNVFSRFKDLIGSASNELVNITTNNGDDTSSGTTLSGNTVVVVKGESVSAGNRALVRDGEVVEVDV